MSVIPKSIVITGCNRGIGLELVKQFLKKYGTSTKIFATCRDTSKATELMELAQNNPGNLKILELEVTDYDSYPKIVKSVADEVKDEGLNILINNAGVLPQTKTLQEINPADMMKAYEVNCIAPTLLAREFLPLLRLAASKNSSASMGPGKAAIIQMSTAVASIAENSGGNLYPYRCSKSALNMSMKNMAIDLKDDGILVMAMHPGWVQTEMGGPNALINTETCCVTMLETIQGLSEKNHGCFLRYNNTSIPW